jgi:hypothetical protein
LGDHQWLPGLAHAMNQLGALGFQYADRLDGGSIVDGVLRIRTVRI